MYYEKRILPIDRAGNFLVAVHFPQNKIGGECTRESSRAYFAYGNINSPDTLTDITSLCCIKRPPSKDEEAQYRQISDVQKNMVGNEKAAWEYEYQAELATREAQFVPRKVLASNTGLLVIGIECENQPDRPLAVQRAIDVSNENIVGERKEKHWPKAKAVAYPSGFSLDGERVMSLDVSNPSSLCFNELSIDDGRLNASLSDVAPMANFFATNGHWVVADDESLLVFQYGKEKPISKAKMPRNAYAWTGEVSVDSSYVAFSGDSGLVSIVDSASGDIKNYYPHRGCKRDDFVALKLSADGKWMASKVFGKTELVLTDLTFGCSWKLADLNEEIVIEREDSGYQSESRIPAAFSFIEDRLLISEGKGIQELSVAEPDDKTLIYVSEQGKPGARVPLKLTPKATLDKIVKQARLQRISDDIQSQYFPACKLVTKKSKKSGWYMLDRRGAPSLGESRFGGWPDLPKGCKWPSWQGRPMGFLGQVNLAEISKVQPGIRLPKEGVLLFFLGCMEDTYENDFLSSESYMLDIMLGATAGHKGGWKVIYAEAGVELVRTEYKGAILPELFAPCGLKYSKGGLSLPDEHTGIYDCINFNEEERENYNEVLDLISEEEAENQLSGYPNLIQFTPPEFFCTLASSNKDPFVFPNEDTPEYAELVKKSAQLGMLIQFTSDENPGFLWGDAGHLYFYGVKEEMEQGNFDNCWVYYEN